MRPSRPTSSNSFTILSNVCRLTKDFHFSKFDSTAWRNLQGERLLFPTQTDNTPSRRRLHVALGRRAKLFAIPHTHNPRRSQRFIEPFSFSPTLFIAAMMHQSSLKKCVAPASATAQRFSGGFDATADASLALVNGNIEGGEWPGELVETESGGCACDADADDGDTRWICSGSAAVTRTLDRRGGSGSHRRRRKAE